MRVVTIAAAGVVLSLGVLVEPVAAACPADSVQSGVVCIDKYESSVWDLSLVSTGGKARERLIASIQFGTVTLASLQSAGAVQRGLAPGDLAANGCPATGNGCLNVYAVSLPGVVPSAYVTWFQAAAAARNSAKRLPTNLEWQVAALGTPDPGTADDQVTTCNTNSSGVADAGSRGACVSDVGAFDMVGNVWEWVADWIDQAQAGASWPATFGADASNVGGPGVDSGVVYSAFPGALHRGGDWTNGAFAGVFAINAGIQPSGSSGLIGFRCAR